MSAIHVRFFLPSPESQQWNRKSCRLSLTFLRVMNTIIVSPAKDPPFFNYDGFLLLAPQALAESWNETDYDEWPVKPGYLHTGVVRGLPCVQLGEVPTHVQWAQGTYPTLGVLWLWQFGPADYVHPTRIPVDQLELSDGPILMEVDGPWVLFDSVLQGFEIEENALKFLFHKEQLQITCYRYRPNEKTSMLAFVFDLLGR